MHRRDRQDAAQSDGDDTHACGSFTYSAYPLLYGTPDVNHDGVPGIWATDAAGALLLYQGGATGLGSAATVSGSGWSTVRQLG
ncbi:hypothetical protein ACFV2H_19725 [Streptomyces sp. NPDC059629]|uniref:hypothetical protein n=1 Tax=Streptomyces sp. NPDC059629 TaxID=3346889 RepID=UPI00368494B8